VSNVPSQKLLEEIAEIVGPAGVVTNKADKAPYLQEWRNKFSGDTRMVVRPSSTVEVSKVLALTYAAGVAIVPQGGNTGLVGGQIPDGTGNELLLSLDRMTTIENIDLLNDTMRVQAGCVLSNIHDKADEQERLFPLSLASEGSARIGGLLSTNAGGTNVLRYGNARDQVLGLEVVLPDGSIWDGLRALRKDNTGYDLKQLFVGAEGTLGIITGAVLKLFPKPQDVATAFVGLGSPAQAVDLLNMTKAQFGPALTGFELIPRLGVDFVTAHMEGIKDPLDRPCDWYVLLEVTSTDGPGTLWPKVESFLSPMLEEEQIYDAAIATNEDQRQKLWRLRDNLSEAQKHEGGSIKHDVSIPISEIAQFIEEATEAVQKSCPGIRPIPFGHLGDGNIHFNLSQPVGDDTKAYLDRWQELNDVVHGIAHRFGGSISAEHGIGQLKRTELRSYKSEIELNLMRSLKRAIDPKGLMNPGKVL
jgi:FAD/FMN-containing dehydrogenase